MLLGLGEARTFEMRLTRLVDSVEEVGGRIVSHIFGDIVSDVCFNFKLMFYFAVLVVSLRAALLMHHYVTQYLPSGLLFFYSFLRWLT